MKKVLFDEYELPIKIKAEVGGGYVANCPLWKDCYAQGETIDEAVLEITAVAQTLIELYKEEDQEIPLRSVKKNKTRTQFSVPIFVGA